MLINKQGNCSNTSFLIKSPTRCQRLVTAATLQTNLEVWALAQIRENGIAHSWYRKGY